jgi:predicted neutral ceramidase superfamily lipid hydrolase
MAPASAEQLIASVQASPNSAKYTAVMDRESAYEKLAAKVQAAADRAEAEADDVPKAQRQEKSMVEQVVGSSAFRQFARSAGREIVRGLFGAARRR